MDNEFAVNLQPFFKQCGFGCFDQILRLSSCHCLIAELGLFIYASCVSAISNVYCHIPIKKCFADWGVFFSVADYKAFKFFVGI